MSDEGADKDEEEEIRILKMRADESATRIEQYESDKEVAETQFATLREQLAESVAGKQNCESEMEHLRKKCKSEYDALKHRYELSEISLHSKESEIKELKSSVDKARKSFEPSALYSALHSTTADVSGSSMDRTMFYERKTRRLDKSTPVFGKDMSIKIDQWLILVENNFKIDNVSPNMKVNVCLPFLRGSAFETCKKAVLANWSWEKFKKELETSHMQAWTHLIRWV